MTTITGRFDLTHWDEEIFDDAEGAKLVRARVGKRFEDGLTGTSTAEILQTHSQGDSRAYVGIERVSAEIDGRKGTFVLRHSALASGSGGDMRVDVVPDSATDDLVGLRGEMTINLVEGEHTYRFEYTLP